MSNRPRKQKRAAELKNTANALFELQKFINGYLDLYKANKIGTHISDAKLLAFCINQCCNSFSDSLNNYLNNTGTPNNKTNKNQCQKI